MERLLCVLAAALVAAPAAISADYLNARDFVFGDGVHDDAPALNRLLAAAPDFSEIVFPSGMRMAIGATILIHGKSGLKLTGLSGIGNGVSPSSGAPQFVWAGPSGGAMFSINKSQGLVVENLLFSP